MTLKWPPFLCIWNRRKPRATQYQRTAASESPAMCDGEEMSGYAENLKDAEGRNDVSDNHHHAKRAGRPRYAKNRRPVSPPGGDGGGRPTMRSVANEVMQRRLALLRQGTAYLLRNSEQETTRKERLIRFVQEADFHGLKRALREQANPLQRVFWISATLACTALLAYYITEQCMNYYSYPHNTKVDVVYVPRAYFPSFTICNSNKFKMSTITAADMSQIGKWHFSEALVNDTWEFNNASRYTPDTRVKIEALLAEVRTGNYSESSEYDLEDATRRMGHTINEMLEWCTWNKLNRCTEDNFHSFPTSRGLCHTINTDEAANPEWTYQVHPGYKRGLHIVLNINSSDWSFEDIYGRSIRFQVHPRGEISYVEELSVLMEAGYIYYIPVSATKHHNLPAPWGNCYKEKKLKYFKNYSYMACLKECQTDNQMRVCGCKDTGMPGPARVCFINESSCTETKMTETDDYTCDCEDECDQMTYNYNVFPFRFDKSEPDRIQLFIYFEFISETVVEQVPAYVVETLLSDIGGQMGLFLGGSILTLLHFIEYIVEEGKYTADEKKKNKEEAKQQDERFVRVFRQPLEDEVGGRGGTSLEENINNSNSLWPSPSAVISSNKARLKVATPPSTRIRPLASLAYWDEDEQL